MTKPIIEPHYNAQEIAAALGYTPETILKWARQNRIAHTHGPGKILIPLSEIERIKREGIPTRKHQKQREATRSN